MLCVEPMSSCCRSRLMQAHLPLAQDVMGMHSRLHSDLHRSKKKDKEALLKKE